MRISKSVPMAALLVLSLLLSTMPAVADIGITGITGYDYDLQVTVNAYPTFTRTYNWYIDKVADYGWLTLMPGQMFLVNYDVTVISSYTDSDWAVWGEISIYNPSPDQNAIIESVTDVVAPDIAAAVSCGVTFPYALAPLGTLGCTYSTALPDQAGRINTATVVTSGYVGGGYATVGVVFLTPTSEVDECAHVYDSYAGYLALVCYPNVPRTFEYSRWIGPYTECGEHTVGNVASYEAKDTGKVGESNWTVYVDVKCGGGCTLTPGYWKTHSEFGPAPYDDTWAQLPNGASTPFFLSGQTYHQVLWTPPSGGNAYYILAHPYIAAQLNMLNGATSTPAVDEAMAWATGFFNTYTPSSRLSRTVRAQAIYYAGVLDHYNNGLIGPGHCSE